MSDSVCIRFYFKKGKWHVTSDKKAVPANLWWQAINKVKCMNHKIRTKNRNVSLRSSDGQMSLHDHPPG